MALVDELSGVTSGGNIVLSSSLEKYDRLWADAASYLSKKGPGLVLSLNKSYPALTKLMEANGIDAKKLTFIDCVTYNEEKREGNCIYLEKPFNPTYVSIILEPFIKGDTRFFIFDSLSSFTLYQPLTIVKFFHFTLSQLALHNKTGVILDVDTDTTNTIVKAVTQACNKLVKV
ncbi:MAG: hypothetical protein HY366_03205 [Candidatus Aenigmarchaeota archaeon]|nr:hypothetical protein [Candidatus Aenigmarchaeota archaeon]